MLRRWPPGRRETGLGSSHTGVGLQNAHSSFFSGKPFRLLLPDLGGLYIDAVVLDIAHQMLKCGAIDRATRLGGIVIVCGELEPAFVPLASDKLSRLRAGFPAC